MRIGFRRPLALALAVVYFATNTAFVHAAETSIWSERRKLAALPTAPNPAPALFIPPSQRIATVAGGGEKVVSVSAFPPRLQQVIKAVPGAAAQIRSVSYPAGSDDKPIVVLMQDVHYNGEAQRNIAAALASLSDGAEPGRRLRIGIEAAFGPFNFSDAIDAGDASVRRAVADAFLAANRIAAASYVGLSATVAPDLVGVDDRPAYDANVAAYRTGAAVRAEAEREVARGSAENEQAKATGLNPDLRAIDLAMGRYNRGDIGLGAYVDFLTTFAAQHSSEEQPADISIENFLAAYRLEKSLDFHQVDADRKKVVARLAATLSKTEIETLVSASLTYQAGGLSMADYFRHIEQLVERHNLRLAETPAFERYLQYVMLADGIRAETLLASVKNLETSLVEGACRTPRERDLMRASRVLQLREKLLAFSLTADEWTEYAALKDDGAGMTASLASFQDFYRQADLRSSAMVANLLPQGGRGADVSALVAGGFHTSGITNLLRDRKIPYVVLQPKITTVAGLNGNEYLSVFTREKTPLDRLFQGEKLFLGVEAQHAGAPNSRPAAETYAAVVAATRGVAAVARGQLSRGVRSLGNGLYEFFAGGFRFVAGRSGQKIPGVPVATVSDGGTTVEIGMEKATSAPESASRRLGVSFKFIFGLALPIALMTGIGASQLGPEFLPLALLVSAVGWRGLPASPFKSATSGLGDLEQKEAKDRRGSLLFSLFVYAALALGYWSILHFTGFLGASSGLLDWAVKLYHLQAFWVGLGVSVSAFLLLVTNPRELRARAARLSHERYATKLGESQEVEGLPLGKVLLKVFNKPIFLVLDLPLKPLAALTFGLLNPRKQAVKIKMFLVRLAFNFWMPGTLKTWLLENARQRIMQELLQAHSIMEKRLVMNRWALDPRVRLWEDDAKKKLEELTLQQLMSSSTDVDYLRRYRTERERLLIPLVALWGARARTIGGVNEEERDFIMYLLFDELGAASAYGAEDRRDGAIQKKARPMLATKDDKPFFYFDNAALRAKRWADDPANKEWLNAILNDDQAAVAEHMTRAGLDPRLVSVAAWVGKSSNSKAVEAFVSNDPMKLKNIAIRPGVGDVPSLEDIERVRALDFPPTKDMLIKVLFSVDTTMVGYNFRQKHPEWAAAILSGDRDKMDAFAREAESRRAPSEPAETVPTEKQIAESYPLQVYPPNFPDFKIAAWARKNAAFAKVIRDADRNGNVDAAALERFMRKAGLDPKLYEVALWKERNPAWADAILKGKSDQTKAFENAAATGARPSDAQNVPTKEQLEAVANPDFPPTPDALQRGDEVAAYRNSWAGIRNPYNVAAIFYELGVVQDADGRDLVKAAAEMILNAHPSEIPLAAPTGDAEVDANKRAAERKNWVQIQSAAARAMKDVADKETWASSVAKILTNPATDPLVKVYLLRTLETLTERFGYAPPNPKMFKGDSDRAKQEMERSKGMQRAWTSTVSWLVETIRKEKGNRQILTGAIRVLGRLQPEDLKSIHIRSNQVAAEGDPGSVYFSRDEGRTPLEGIESVLGSQLLDFDVPEAQDAAAYALLTLANRARSAWYELRWWRASIRPPDHTLELLATFLENPRSQRDTEFREYVHAETKRLANFTKNRDIKIRIAAIADTRAEEKERNGIVVYVVDDSRSVSETDRQKIVRSGIPAAYINDFETNRNQAEQDPSGYLTPDIRVVRLFRFMDRLRKGLAALNPRIDGRRGNEMKGQSEKLIAENNAPVLLIGAAEKYLATKRAFLGNNHGDPKRLRDYDVDMPILDVNQADLLTDGKRDPEKVMKASLALSAFLSRLVQAIKKGQGEQVPLNASETISYWKNGALITENVPVPVFRMGPDGPTLDIRAFNSDEQKANFATLIRQAARYAGRNVPALTDGKPSVTFDVRPAAADGPAETFANIDLSKADNRRDVRALMNLSADDVGAMEKDPALLDATLRRILRTQMKDDTRVINGNGNGYWIARRFKDQYGLNSPAWDRLIGHLEKTSLQPALVEAIGNAYRAKQQEAADAAVKSGGAQADAKTFEIELPAEFQRWSTTFGERKQFRLLLAAAAAAALPLRDGKPQKIFPAVFRSDGKVALEIDDGSSPFPRGLAAYADRAKKVADHETEMAPATATPQDGQNASRSGQAVYTVGLLLSVIGLISDVVYLAGLSHSSLQIVGLIATAVLLTVVAAMAVGSAVFTAVLPGGAIAVTRNGVTTLAEGYSLLGRRQWAQTLVALEEAYHRRTRPASFVGRVWDEIMAKTAALVGGATLLLPVLPAARRAEKVALAGLPADLTETLLNRIIETESLGVDERATQGLVRSLGTPQSPAQRAETLAILRLLMNQGGNTAVDAGVLMHDADAAGARMNVLTIEATSVEEAQRKIDLEMSRARSQDATVFLVPAALQADLSRRNDRVGLMVRANDAGFDLKALLQNEAKDMPIKAINVMVARGAPLTAQALAAISALQKEMGDNGAVRIELFMLLTQADSPLAVRVTVKDLLQLQADVARLVQIQA